MKHWKEEEKKSVNRIFNFTWCLFVRRRIILLSSPTGPAEHWAGGSLDRSVSSWTQIKHAVITIHKQPSDLWSHPQSFHVDTFHRKGPFGLKPTAQQSHWTFLQSSFPVWSASLNRSARLRSFSIFFCWTVSCLSTNGRTRLHAGFTSEQWVHKVVCQGGKGVFKITSRFLLNCTKLQMLMNL